MIESTSPPAMIYSAELLPPSNRNRPPIHKAIPAAVTKPVMAKNISVKMMSTPPASMSAAKSDGLPICHCPKKSRAVATKATRPPPEKPAVLISANNETKIIAIKMICNQGDASQPTSVSDHSGATVMRRAFCQP